MDQANGRVGSENNNFDDTSNVDNYAEPLERSTEQEVSQQLNQKLGNIGLADNLTQVSTQPKPQDAESIKEKYPDFYQEMVDNNVPLNTKEFQEQGYGISKTEDGFPRVLYPDTKINDILEKNPEIRHELIEKKIPFNEESIKEAGLSIRESLDGSARLIRQPYSSILDTDAKIKKGYEAKLEEELGRQEKLGKARQKREYFVEKTKEYVSNEAIDDTVERLFPDEKFSSYKRARMRSDVPDLVNVYLELREDYLKEGGISADDAYRGALIQQLNNGTIDAPSDEQIRQYVLDELNSRLRVKNSTHGWNSYKRGFNYYYTYETPIVAQEILKNCQGTLLREGLDTITGDLTPEKKEEVFKYVICNDEDSYNYNPIRNDILDSLIEKQPDVAVDVIKRFGVDKSDVSLRRGLLANRYSSIGQKEKRAALAEFFGLEELVGDMMDNPAENGISFRDGEFYIKNQGYLDKKMPTEVTRIAIDRRNELLSNIAESLRGNPDISAEVEQLRETEIKLDYHQTKAAILDYSANDLRSPDSEYFDNLLHTRSIEWSTYSGLESITIPEGYEDVISKKEVTNILFPDKTMEVDRHNAVSEALFECLKKGVGESWKRPKWPLTDIFQTEFFEKNRDELDIDFADPQVFDGALSGFMKVLMLPHGETSDAANWYYDNIFSNNLEKFDFMLDFFHDDKSTPKNLKSKITKFKNSSEKFQEYKSQLERGTFIRQSAKLDDIQELVKRRKSELLNQIKEYGAIELEVFDGITTLPATHPETNHYRKVEAPEDFGVRKVQSLIKAYNFIKNNIPGAFPDGGEEDGRKHWFVDSFSSVSAGQHNQDDEFVNVNLKSKYSYVGFTFIYNGKKCVLAESFKKDAAMYAMCLDEDDDYKDLLGYSRYDATRTNDPRITPIRHFEVQKPESIDEAIQKAFLFFSTGDKDLIKYSTHGSKDDYVEYKRVNFPEDVIGIDGTEDRNPGDLARWHAWQERQDMIKHRLQMAAERGGADEEAVERRRIAEEEYERILASV